MVDRLPIRIHRFIHSFVLWEGVASQCPKVMKSGFLFISGRKVLLVYKILLEISSIICKEKSISYGLHIAINSKDVFFLSYIKCHNNYKI